MYSSPYELAGLRILYYTSMPRSTSTILPGVQRTLRELGDNIRLARLRRGFSMQLVADRAGMTRVTLTAIEKGEPGVSLAAYANVLHVLGLHQDLSEVASDDDLGRKLQDAQLSIPRRARRKPAT